MTTQVTPAATRQSIVETLRLIGVVTGVVVAYVVCFQIASSVARSSAGGSAIVRIGVWVGISPLVAFVWTAALGVWRGSGPSIRSLFRSLAVLAVGSLGAALSAAGLISWSLARLGDWNLALTGITSLLPLATSLLGFAVAARPFVTAPTSRILAATVAVSAIIGVVTLVLNVRGVLDGLSPAALQLGLSLGSFAAVAATALFVTRRWQSNR